MPHSPYEIRCTQCDALAAPLDWRCARCGGVLEFAEIPAFDPRWIDTAQTSIWRYQRWSQIQPDATLGEGMTPLVPLPLEHGQVSAKLEYLNPTGSYKDRGTAFLLNHMKAHNVETVVEDSSGNAGASVAAYASRLGIRSHIYVPESAASSKKALIKTFGGNIIEIPGPQHAKTEACQEAAATVPYASHAWSPYFVLGQMTAAFEIWEQTRSDLPGVIVTPLGHGSLFLGIYRGLKLLQAAGLIANIPHLVAVQSERCDPVVQAFEVRAATVPHIRYERTIADGIIVHQPVRGAEVLAALYDTSGSAFRVNEESITTARDWLWERGFIAEPTSATTVAALPQVQRRYPGETILVTLTGNALKYVR